MMKSCFNASFYKCCHYRGTKEYVGNLFITGRMLKGNDCVGRVKGWREKCCYEYKTDTI